MSAGPMSETPPGLPEGWVLDPAVTEHRPDIGVWWVILPDGTRTAWNENDLPCPVCTEETRADCSACSGRGWVDHVPYCDRPWDEIVPGLWVGGHGCQMTGAPNGECLPEDTFDVVVSLHQQYVWDDEASGNVPDTRFDPHPHVTHFRYRMPDSMLDPKHYAHLDLLATHVEGAVRNGDKVLVRCQAGINRAALVAALAMLKMGWTVEAILARMREARSPFVLFNESFVAHLREVESGYQCTGAADGGWSASERCAYPRGHSGDCDA